MTPVPDMPPASPDGAPLRERLDAVVESLDSGLVLFDRRMQITYRNQMSHALLPETSDVTKLLAELTKDQTYEDWATEIRHILETGLPRRIDITASAVGEEEKVIEVIINRLQGPTGAEAVGGVLLAEDVTTRAGMERRLAVSERLAAVGKLAARVAHELNNPLDGILRYTNLALRLLEGDGGAQGGDHAAKIVEYLHNAKTGIVRMTEIIAAMLEFSRNAPTTLEQATINKIVEDAVTAMDGRANESGVTIICNFLQADMPVVRGSNIFQIFCNLTKNAIDAMPDGGTLTITTRIADDDVVVLFEDTGIGLPDDVEKIFEPFFTTKAAGKGTGLGLAVCRDLIEKYGGTITASRRSPRGTAMKVTAPVKNLTASHCNDQVHTLAPAIGAEATAT